MIYFDEEKQAYNNEKTIKNWGKNCIYSCTDEVYDDFIQGKYIWENNILVLNPDWDSVRCEKQKLKKIQDNDILRDEALIKGVTYKNILFDSDTDQKINLLAAVQQLRNSEVQTVIWYGKDNQPLECTTDDLINIGSLITALHSFVWNKNAEIKKAIKEAKTIEELENIEVKYEF